MSAHKPCCIEAKKWLREHKTTRCFAPFTCQDFAAWEAFVHGLKLWASADDQGRMEALGVMRAAAAAMQPKLLHAVRDIIPYVLDWSDIRVLWPQITRTLAQAIPNVDDDSPAAHRRELAAARPARTGGVS